MKILFLTVGNRNVASSRVRVYSYAPYFDKAGIKFVIIPYTSPWQCRKILLNEPEGLMEKAPGKLYGALSVLRMWILAPFFDLVYIQKVCLSKFSFSVLRALNGKTIFDFDDAVYIHKDITHLLKGASVVIVSNDLLKAKAAGYNKNVHRVASPVMVHSGYPRRAGDTVRLGWLGSPEAASKYLDPMLDVFKELMAHFANLSVIFMGSGNRKRYEALGIKVADWSLEGEREFLQNIDIGIMPLEDDEWSQAKAGYKLLLYMSAGVASVASPVGMNKEIIKDGMTGYMAKTHSEWIDGISSLVEDVSLRRRLGDEARRLAGRLYSYDIIAPAFIDILKGA